MKITAIKQQVKNAERVSVFVDGKYSFSLNLDQLLNSKIKKNDEIDEKSINEYKKMSQEGKLKSRTLEWLLIRPHSEREFKDYLFRKKADKDLIEAWRDEFREKGYLNDESFARWFAEGRARKSRSIRAITAELHSKGVSPNTIKSVVTDLNLDKEEKESLKLLVNKLRQKPRYSDDKVLTRYLLRKGFSYGDIKEVI